MIEFYDHKNQASGEETGHKISFQVHHFHPPYQAPGVRTNHRGMLVFNNKTVYNTDNRPTAD